MNESEKAVCIDNENSLHIKQKFQQIYRPGVLLVKPFGLVLILLSIILNCGEGSFTVRGEVRQSTGDDETGPVPDAKVTVSHTRDGELVKKSAITGDNGSFEIFVITDAPDDPNPKKREAKDNIDILIKVTKDGYFSREDTATVQSGDVLEKQYALTTKD